MRETLIFSKSLRLTRVFSLAPENGTQVGFLRIPGVELINIVGLDPCGSIWVYSRVDFDNLGQEVNRLIHIERRTLRSKMSVRQANREFRLANLQDQIENAKLTRVDRLEDYKRLKANGGLQRIAAPLMLWQCLPHFNTVP